MPRNTQRLLMPSPAAGPPEDRARANIDRSLTDASWIIQSRDSVNIEVGRGIAIREFPLAPGYRRSGQADPGKPREFE